MIEANNIMMSNLPSLEEVKCVVFSMNMDGAPSLDGFGDFFFQKYWEIVSGDVTNVVLQFFDQG